MKSLMQILTFHVEGIGTLTLTNPIWVAKTRLIVQTESSNLAVKSTKYDGMLGRELN